jgi:predicted nucleic acid-binding protein
VGHVLSFLTPSLPSKIILDTNFIVNLAFNFTSLHADHIADCKRFANRLYESNAILYVSEWSICEFCHIVYRAKLMVDAKKQLGNEQRWKELYEDNPHIIKKYHSIVEMLLKTIGEITKETRLKENILGIRKKAFKIMKNIDVCPTDAYIIATALMNDVSNIATVNYRCFSRAAIVYPLTIYVPDHMANPPKK